MLNARVQLTQARTTEIQARADYNSFLAEFDRVTATDTIYDETFDDPLARRDETRDGEEARRGREEEGAGRQGRADAGEETLIGVTTPAPLETFAALDCIPRIRHGFTHRVPGIDVHADRVWRSSGWRARTPRPAASAASARTPLSLAIRFTGASLRVVDAQSPVPAGAVDGLITADPRVCLGIYVADCCAVYLVDPVRRVVGLLHSGPQRQRTRHHRRRDRADAPASSAAIPRK